MDPGIDLSTADRAVLIAIIARQKTSIERLEKRIAQLEGRAQSGGCPADARSKIQGRPEASPAPETTPASASRLCPPSHDAYPTGGAYGGHCPDCGTPLSGGWNQRTREVIGLPQVPAQVTEYVYIARTCPRCRRRCIPPAQLDGVVLGQQRLGVNLISLIATLREEPDCPLAPSNGI